ncbi:glutathione S-transferase family protein [Chondromyces apiculatus]|uniref:Glutathione S-transferase, putative n=1 Tax=Chondromyces apiculatus DSM 436 TaxID=1192034 RepID=A0A017T7R7_9BACT|nr:glutathione S-transferase family protein [Chondromyces apiculatus]EYF05007.1 glutathione S-transferase, putative [Chondromyces apiculatus DSM 436]
MITVHGSTPLFGLPVGSPYVTKTEVQLRMMGLPFTTRNAMPTDSPKGQIPFVDDDGTRIADSHFIRVHVEEKHGKDLDQGLDARQRAEAWAIERMIEGPLSAAMVYSRWLIPANFEKAFALLAPGIPEEARPQVRATMQDGVRKSLHGTGITRHTDEEILALSRRSLEALSVVLGDKPYLFGDHPVGVDASAFGMLAAILAPFFDSPLRRCAESFPNLVAYTARMMRQFYPEHPWETPS